jgi:ankyrin repeat protein
MQAAMNDNVDDEAEGRVREEMVEEEEDDDDVSEGSPRDARHRLLNALREEADLDRIRAIVEAHPDAVECDVDAQGNGDWCSALHMAIFEAAEYDVVEYLAQRNPDALQARDHRGRLPLHLAVIYRVRLPVVRMLAEMYPPALRETIGDKTGHLPLHCAFLNTYMEDDDDDELISVERHGRPDVTLFLIQEHPPAAWSRTASGHLPLHLAFADDDGDPWERQEHGIGDGQSVPVEVVGALLKAWPTSISETDHQGSLAIHLACRSALTSPAVVRRLVEEWRESLRRRDVVQGDLPLHHAIRCGMSYGVIEFLVGESPRSVREPTYHRYLALHLHLMFAKQHHSQNLSLALVRLLLSHFPSAIRDKGGREEEEDEEEDNDLLPLHIAADHDAPLSVIRFLVQAYPDALNVRSAEGWLPLHFALRRSDSPDVIRFLVDECPPSLQVIQGGRRVALHVAAERARKIEIIRIVHRAWPEALREKTETGCTPLHLVAMRSFLGSQQAAEGLGIIRYFLDQWPRSVDETTWTGALPVHLAARCASPDAVRLLAERGPKLLLLARPDDDGALPLHRAAGRTCGLKSALEVLQCLIEKAPGALQVADRRGFLPLHEAASSPDRNRSQRFWNQFRLPVVKHLVKAWPHALEVKDKAGRIPLLVAAEADALLGVLYHLLTSCPQAMGGYGFGGGGGDGRHPSQSPCRSKRLRLCASDPDDEVAAGAQESQQLHPLQR